MATSNNHANKLTSAIMKPGQWTVARLMPENMMNTMVLVFVAISYNFQCRYLTEITRALHKTWCHWKLAKIVSYVIGIHYIRRRWPFTERGGVMYWPSQMEDIWWYLHLLIISLIRDDLYDWLMTGASCLWYDMPCDIMTHDLALGNVEQEPITMTYRARTYLQDIYSKNLWCDCGMICMG